MVKMNGKNGTPVGSENLCTRCSWGLCMTGYRESDFAILCMRADPNLRVPFVVMDCSGFDDKHRPSFEQMSKLAIRIAPTRISSRTAGFAAVTKVQPIRVAGNDEDDGEAA